MPYLTFTIRVESDFGAQPSVVFESIKRLFLTEAQLLNMQKAGGDTVGVYTTIPTVNQSPTLNAIVVQTDQPVLIKLNSVVNADGVISLKAGGLVAVIDANIASGATTDATVNNVPANPATLSGVAGGT